MRNVESLLDDLRAYTENTDYSATTGITQNEMIEHLNRAQQKLYMKINDVSPKYYLREYIQTVTLGQEVYSLPRDVFMGGKLIAVDFSSDGRSPNYTPLKGGYFKERVGLVQSTPGFYIRRGNQILLQPTSRNSTGKLRYTYVKTIPRLDIKRATIQTVTTSGTSITALTLDPATINQDTIDLIVKNGFITVIDEYGTVTMRAIPVQAINLTTGVVTLRTFSFVSDDNETETIAAGNYITVGKHSSNVSELDDICEPYLLEYAALKAMLRDSSADTSDQDKEVKDLMLDIIGSYSKPDNDVKHIPILDSDYISLGR